MSEPHMMRSAPYMSVARRNTFSAGMPASRQMSRLMEVHLNDMLAMGASVS